ncbi:uncharacterized protein LOC121424995 [Lytechinus variegatus]|uniref:uncharacterized protein LOC121424995 n=1 Tax=Lytechinus variegatus TaxID=7654 RepID=UPI001BB28392|nr:uncharacterized protein LOC121424995 [Lytechinus variegatus]
MLRCINCKTRSQFPSIHHLFRHLRYIHGIADHNGKTIICGQGACARTFNTFSGFRKHLKKFHQENENGNDQGVDLANEEDESFDVNDTSIEEGFVDNIDQDDNDNNDEVFDILSQEDIEQHAFTFIANLSSRPTISGACMNEIVNSASDLIEGVVKSASAAVKSAFSHHGQPESLVLAEIQEHLTTLKHPFENLNTEYKREKTFSRMGMVKPCEIDLGVPRLENQHNQAVPIEDKFVYIDINKTLEKLVQHPEILSYVKRDHISNDGVLRDFCDGQLYRETDLFKEDPNALQLHFFYDDFQTVNPLGSKTVHKLGAFYFVLKNLPPKFNSSLRNINLVALCYAQDTKTYGYDEILQHFVADINKLATEGISLPDGERKKGTLTQFSADNLGANSLFGFVESFSAAFYCRLCLISKDDAQNIFQDPDTLLRTKDDYNLHVQQAEAAGQHVYGIKNSSVLNDCKFFHILSNFSLDIMHDILEGVAQYEMKLVLQYFIFECRPPVLSLGELNKHLESHDYGVTETKNKPSPVKLDSQGNALGQKAMQAWTLIRHLPFIIGSKVGANDAKWELLLKLLDCMDIIFSPQLTPGLIAELSILIAEHHAYFKEVFPERRLLPKHHFMVHYPRCLRMIGPLVHVWGMRYEAKHEYFGRVADCVRNYKNICISLAKRHQSMHAYNLIAKAPLEAREIGPGREVEVITLTEDCIHLVMEKLQVNDFSTRLYEAKWIKLCGTLYQPSLYVCHDIDELPVFGNIIHILVYESQVYFVLHVCETSYYNKHYHAYVTTSKSPDSYVVVTKSELVDYQPLDIITDVSEHSQNRYISPRHVLFK